MPFGENLAYFRKKSGITQEELAEQLFVTRQTVSRWENGSALPDVEMLVKLCELFSCDMDTLVRGDIDAKRKSKITENPEHKKSAARADIEAWDKHMNSFAFAIAFGVWLIIFGVSLMLFCQALTYSELVGLIIFFVLLASAIVIFIIYGIQHEEFLKVNPKAPPYPVSNIYAFKKKFAFLIAGAVLLLFAGIITLIIMCFDENSYPDILSSEDWEILAAAIFLFIVSVSTYIFVLSGILYSKYEKEDVNGENEEAEIDSDEKKLGLKKRADKICDSACGAIMLSATALFLFLGFVKMLWHPAWVVFPIGGILCGICSTIKDGITK